MADEQQNDPPTESSLPTTEASDVTSTEGNLSASPEGTSPSDAPAEAAGEHVSAGVSPDGEESNPQTPAAPESEEAVAEATSASADVGEAPEESSDHEGEAGAESSETTDGTEDAQPAEPAEGASDAEAAASGDADSNEAGKSKGGKKKRRGKRGKGEDGAPKSPSAFARFFSGAGTRKQAFGVGEVVGGRVQSVSEGGFVVDLFGRGLAVVDAYEPREVPVIETPEPSEVTEPASEGEETNQASAPEASAPDAKPAEEPVAEEPVAEETVAPEADVATDAAPAEDDSQAAAETSEAAEAAAGDGAESVDATEQAEASAAAEEPKVELPPPPAAPEGPPPEAPDLGSVFRGRVGGVSESGHVAIVNRIVDRALAKAWIGAARESRERVRGLVFGFNRGGFDVLVHGVRCFCPASSMSLEPITDPHVFIGQMLEFSVAARKGGKKALVVTRRSVLEREARKRARERMKELKVGDRLSGKVLEIRDYGVIVDIGDGCDGLVHQSEVAWGRGVRISDVVSVGDTVDVDVLKIQLATRRDRHGKLSLSIKSASPDPWDAHGDVLKIGVPQKGTVVRTTDFGAFVELAPGIEGLLHISELGKGLKHANQALEDGQEVQVIAERVDNKQRRISLSMLSEAEIAAIASGDFDPATRPKSLKVGSRVTVVIDRVEHAGISGHVKGVLGRKGRAFIPNRELGNQSDSDKRTSREAGSEIQVKIIGTDRSGALRCSVKGLEIDEERRAVREYRKEAAKQGLGTFADLLKSKLSQGGGDS